MSASTTPNMCWLWGGLEVEGIKKAAQAIKQHNHYNNGITSSPPLPAEEFMKVPNFVPGYRSAWFFETYNAVRAQEPDHCPAAQQQVGQSSSDYQRSSSVSQASALQPYGTRNAGGFIGGYSQGSASEQQLAYHAAYSGQPTQYQEDQYSSSDSQSWAMHSFTDQTSATQSYVGQLFGGYTAVHSRGFQSGQRGQGSQGGQDDQYYYEFPMDHTRFKNRDGDYSLVAIVPHRVAKGSFDTLSFIFHGCMDHSEGQSMSQVLECLALVF
ncbi:hypothetical protein BHYA_0005g01130 [Botrytis hyacinthi]|uniref:Uncharacterized protein n=1 Tax=Botrytis hyacinthi TaxID=278943 RepID=A0A4Z1HCT8_9HELO|nr:hypothetical protein BHYA_0005g01130 [Botrytis hyacinthi]